MAAKKTPAAMTAGLLPLAVALVGSSITGPTGTRAPVPVPERSTATQNSRLAIYPDPDLTPGVTNPDVTQENIANTICNKSWSTSTIRPPESYTEELKKRQLTVYADTVSDPDATCALGSDNTKCYEEDHLISLENGGNPKDPGNLWPEPYDTMINGQTVGARQKDLVEGFIHDEICFDVPDSKRNSRMPAKASIPLTRGQEILARDWYSCYVTMLAGESCK